MPQSSQMLVRRDCDGQSRVCAPHMISGMIGPPCLDITRELGCRRMNTHSTGSTIAGCQCNASAAAARADYTRALVVNELLT